MFSAYRAGNLFLATRQTAERSDEGTPFYVTRHLPDWHMTRPGSMCFPITLNGHPEQSGGLFGRPDRQSPHPRANLSERARDFLAAIGIEDPDSDPETAGMLWMHTLAVGFSPAYLTQNGDGIRQDWPRIPLPAGQEVLAASAALGRQVAALLDPEAEVPGVTAKPIRPELRVIGNISRVGGGRLQADADDLAVTVGWGQPGKGGVCMPGKGRTVEREYTTEERDAIQAGAEALGMTLEQALGHLGTTTRDIYLNDLAYWKNVPARVWDYTIGGYQVIKKWLSYRERPLLGRPLHADEAREVRDIARRLAALLLLEPALDANYTAVRGVLFDWSSARS